MNYEEKIYEVLREFFDPACVEFWLDTPSSYFEHRSPRSWIMEGRAEQVLEIMEANWPG